MNTETIRDKCLQLPGVTEDIKWGKDLCFSVGGKMFLVVGPDQSPVSASFKVSDEDFDEMSARPGFKPAPYMAKHKWVWVVDISLMKEKEWNSVIKQSYQLVKSKLSKKMQEKLK